MSPRVDKPLRQPIKLRGSAMTNVNIKKRLRSFFTGAHYIYVFKFTSIMRAVIQRVSRASVTIEGTVKSSIGQGLLVLLGIEDADTIEDIQWLSNKIVNLRIFDDADGVMNESLLDKKGELLLVSQFTLQASTKKGNRPSYIKASKPPIAIPLYEKMIQQLEKELGRPVQTGEFGADMKVELLNDGPVTIVIDTKNKE
jgi:D-aminoacyl-tRNA deacylase